MIQTWRPTTPRLSRQVMGCLCTPDPQIPAGSDGPLGARLKRRTWSGFADGYRHGMLAAGAGSLVIMALADWILPFVYNIGFPGFQASVLVRLYLGGLVALEKLPTDRPQPAALAE